MNFIKPIIVVYVNLGNLSAQDAEEYIQGIKSSVITEEIQIDYHVLIVGREELPNEIVLLNPNFFITEEQRETLNNLLKEYEQRKQRE